MKKGIGIAHVLPAEGDYSYLEVYYRGEKENEIFLEIDIDEEEKLKFIIYPNKRTFELSFEDVCELWERIQKFHREALQVAKDNRRIFGDDW